MKECGSSKSKYIKSFKIVLYLKILLPSYKSTVVKCVQISLEFYFESNTNGKAALIFKRDDVIIGSAPSAVPSKVLSLANLSDIKTTLSSVYIMDKSGIRFNVQLYIYDLSKGMARNLSPIMLGEYR